MHPEITDSMDELRRRVMAGRAAGMYGPDDIGAALVPVDADPLVRGLADAARLAEVAQPPRAAGELPAGLRGAAVRARNAAADLARRPVGDVAERTTAFNIALVAYVAELAQEVARLQAEVERLSGDRPDRPHGGA